ncbi:proton myo-inositol cotransporter-like [Thrips palmi]|uniref:Proton myo-inositol cotransporter-like n=1 Tax=Thrips palmi TaxID=161013 RepID=A0A6P9AAC3_THRPL|nr:proton myo-inositol cotransporter-like [Thrips palmi]
MLLIRPEMQLENAWHEYIVSGTVLAAWVFSYVGGYAVDRFGRRRSIVVAALVFTTGSLGMAFSPNKELLLVGRIVVGMGVGLASMSTPVYLAETSAPAVRGKAVTTFNVGVTFGQFVASLVCGLFSSVEGGWRWMLGLAGLPSAGLLVGALVLPESPRWLVMQGRVDEAEAVLLVLRGGASSADKHAGVLRELQEIKDSSEEGGKAGGKVPEGQSVVLRVLRTPSARRPLIIGCMLASVQQLAGVNTVMYYSASIIQMAGIGDSAAAIWLSVVVALANFTFAVVGVFLIERCGRRPLLLGSLMGVVVALCLLATGFLAMDITSPKIHKHDLLDDDPCVVATRCSECVSSSLGCGFCFATDGNMSVQSSCHKLGSGNVPMADVCHTDDVSWAVGWCPSAYSWIAITALVLYLVMFSPGLGPVPWTVNSEIHPLWARGVSSSMSTSCHWAFNLLVSLTFLTLVENLTAKGTFLVYAILGVIGAVLIWALLPETRGVRLEDMEAVFRTPAARPARGLDLVGEGGLHQVAPRVAPR